MSNCCNVMVCVGGKSYLANTILDVTGRVVSGTYTDEFFQLQTLNAGGFGFGACPANNGAENELIIGLGVPTVAPVDPTEAHARINQSTGRIDYVWNPQTSTWVAVAPQFVGLNLAASNGASQALLNNDTVSIVADQATGVLATTMTGTDTVQIGTAPRVAGNTGAPLSATSFVIGDDGKYHAIQPAKVPFEVVQPLVAGNNVITHNLALAAPFAQIVQVDNATTGATVTRRVIAASRTANATTIFSAVAVASARITIAG